MTKGFGVLHNDFFDCATLVFSFCTQWFLNRNWNLAKYGKGEPLDNKKKTLTRGAIKSLQTFLNNSNLFDPLSVPVEGDDDDDDEDDEELS